MQQKKRLGKFLIPRQQITYAIKIHLLGGDLVCAHPLAEAARHQLMDNAQSAAILPANGGKNLGYRQGLKRRLPQASPRISKSKEVLNSRLTKRPDPVWMRDYLFDTILLYEKVTKSTFPAAKLYTMWYLASNRDLIWTTTAAGKELYNVSERFAVQEQWWAQAASSLE